MTNLDSQTGKQEARLHQVSQDTLQAYKWVRNNQDKFDNPVIGPPIVTCSITNPKYADAIEALLSKNDVLAFTVQSRKDFRTLQHHLVEQLKLHDITIKTSPSRDVPTSSISDQELQELGFDGWAKDFISGPEPVIASLCLENRFGHTPIGLKPFSGEQAEVDELRAKGTAMFVAGPQMYQTSHRAEYNASSTSVKPVRPAKFWTSQPVDTSVKEHHRQNIEKWTRQKEEVDKQIESFKTELANVGKSHRELGEAIVSFTARNNVRLLLLLITIAGINRGRKGCKTNCSHKVARYSRNNQYDLSLSIDLPSLCKLTILQVKRKGG
jgi:hypothetical protein